MIDMRNICDCFRRYQVLKNSSGRINFVEVREDGFGGFLDGGSEGQVNIIIKIIGSKEGFIVDIEIES